MKRLLPFVLLIVLVHRGGRLLRIRSEPRAPSCGDYRSALQSVKEAGGDRADVHGLFSADLRIAQIAVMKEEGTRFLEIDAASAPLDLVSLLHLKFVPSVLQFTHLETDDFPRRRTDIGILADWLSAVSSGAGKPGPYTVTWMDGEIHWQDPYASPPQELVLGGLSGSWDPSKARAQRQRRFYRLGSPAHLTFAKGSSSAVVRRHPADRWRRYLHDPCRK